MRTKLLGIVAISGFIISGSVFADDYSAGLVNPGSGRENGGTAVNLYRITEKGIKLAEVYVSPSKDYSGNPASPLTLAINPQHDFVYAVYTGPAQNKSGDSYQPILVGLKITEKGLHQEWESEVATGGPSLANSSISAENGYVIENTFPSGSSLFVVVVNQEGQTVVSDTSSFLVSGHVNGKVYYSCRGASGRSPDMTVAPPATSVALFTVEHDVEVVTYKVAPQITSTDPVFVASVCNPAT